MFPQLVMTFSAFCRTISLFPPSQEPATCLCAEPDVSLRRIPSRLHFLYRYITCYVFTLRICYPLVQNPSWRSTPFRMSVTDSPVYSQLPSLWRSFTPSAACSSDDALKICVVLRRSMVRSSA
jgi:hypothetical protein